jgi:hypothetical protein
MKYTRTLYLKENKTINHKFRVGEFGSVDFLENGVFAHRKQQWSCYLDLR